MNHPEHHHSLVLQEIRDIQRRQLSALESIARSFRMLLGEVRAMKNEQNGESPAQSKYVRSTFVKTHARRVP